MPRQLISPSLKGRYMKMGLGWVKLEDVEKVTFIGGPNKRLRVKHKAASGKPDHVYDGNLVDEVREKLKKEGHES